MKLRTALILVLCWFCCLTIYCLPVSVSALYLKATTNMEASSDRAESADIVVIGSGLAGLSAAIEATFSFNAGAVPSIVILEKENRIGGNSAKASSGINAAISAEDVSAFMQDTLHSGGGRSKETLVEMLIQNSASAIDFLKAKEIDLSVNTQLGGHSAKRTHRNSKGPNVGFAIISKLHAYIESLPNIRILKNARVVRLLDENNGQKVTGVVYSEGNDQRQREIRAPSVIVCTGGYAASKTFLRRFNQDREHFPTTNGPWATGDGIDLGTSVQASLIDMELIQLHPTGFVDPSDPKSATKFLAPEALRGHGGILLNSAGKRFVDELTTRDIVSKAIMDQEGSLAYLILSKEAAEEFGMNTIKFYESKKLVQSIDTKEELLNMFPTSTAEDLLYEMSIREDTCSSQTCGNTTGYYLMKVVPVLHYCMGGLEINEKAQVLRAQNSAEKVPIEGLFAAGEVTGGVHGKNRLGGNSLLECVVFGRIAGAQALQHSSVQ